MTELQEALRSLLADKATELLADYGIAAVATDEVGDGGRELCGILGFTGDTLCGSVVIAATEPAISCTNPIGDGATRGWVAELTNQLVGRFKNAMFRGGIEVAMSIPVVLTATQITPLPEVDVHPTKLKVGDGFLTIWLETEAQPGLALAEPSADSMIAAEGESFIF